MHCWVVFQHNCLPRLCFKPPQDLGPRIARYFRALLYLFNLHTLLLGFMACLAVYICDKYHFSYNMDLTLVATGTTFPLIFNIQQAFTRREKALTLIANLKASAVGLYFMHRDWAQDENFPASLGNDHNVAALHCKVLLMDLLKDVRAYLIADSPWESYAEQRLQAKHHPYVNMLMANMSLSGTSQLSFAAAVESYQKADPAAAALRRCYRNFSRLSVLNERLGLRSGYTKGGEGGMSRTNQYLRYIISNLEELRMIREYRTPIMMRYANGVLLHIFAIFLAPYFVHFCDSWTSVGYSRGSCPAGYSAAVVFVVIVLLLYHVQQDIENPFDMNGLDDVFFDIGSEVMDDVMLNTLTSSTGLDISICCDRFCTSQPNSDFDGCVVGGVQCTSAGAAAPSGWTTPRHPAASVPDNYCSNGACPGSPNPRGPVDLHLGTPRLVQQASSLLQPVSEGTEGLGGDSFATESFAAVGFAGPAGAMHCSSSARPDGLGTMSSDTASWLSKQQQPANSGGPFRSWSPTPRADSADEEGIVPRISSNGSLEKMQRSGSAPRRSGAAGPAGERRKILVVDTQTPQATGTCRDGRNSCRTSAIMEGAWLAGSGSSGRPSTAERVLERSTSSNNSREGLIKSGQYSSVGWQ